VIEDTSYLKMTSLVKRNSVGTQILISVAQLRDYLLEELFDQVEVLYSCLQVIKDQGKKSDAELNPIIEDFAFIYNVSLHALDYALHGIYPDSRRSWVERDKTLFHDDNKRLMCSYDYINLLLRELDICLEREQEKSSKQRNRKEVKLSKKIMDTLSGFSEVETYLEEVRALIHGAAEELNEWLRTPADGTRRYRPNEGDLTSVTFISYEEENDRVSENFDMTEDVDGTMLANQKYKWDIATVRVDKTVHGTSKYNKTLLRDESAILSRGVVRRAQFLMPASTTAIIDTFKTRMLHNKRVIIIPDVLGNKLVKESRSQRGTVGNSSNDSNNSKTGNSKTGNSSSSSSNASQTGTVGNSSSSQTGIGAILQSLRDVYDVYISPKKIETGDGKEDDHQKPGDGKEDEHQMQVVGMEDDHQMQVVGMEDEHQMQVVGMEDDHQMQVVGMEDEHQMQVVGMEDDQGEASNIIKYENISLEDVGVHSDSLYININTRHEVLGGIIDKVSEAEEKWKSTIIELLLLECANGKFVPNLKAKATSLYGCVLTNGKELIATVTEIALRAARDRKGVSDIVHVQSIVCSLKVVNGKLVWTEKAKAELAASYGDNYAQVHSTTIDAVEKMKIDKTEGNQLLAARSYIRIVNNTKQAVSRHCFLGQKEAILILFVCFLLCKSDDVNNDEINSQLLDIDSNLQRKCRDIIESVEDLKQHLLEHPIDEWYKLVVAAGKPVKDFRTKLPDENKLTLEYRDAGCRKECVKFLLGNRIAVRNAKKGEKDKKEEQQPNATSSSSSSSVSRHTNKSQIGDGQQQANATTSSNNIVHIDVTKSPISMGTNSKKPVCLDGVFESPDVIAVNDTDAQRRRTINNTFESLVTEIVTTNYIEGDEGIVLGLRLNVPMVKSMVTFIYPSGDHALSVNDFVHRCNQQTEAPLLRVFRKYDTNLYEWTKPDGLCFYRALFQAKNFRQAHLVKAQFEYDEMQFNSFQPDLTTAKGIEQFDAFLDAAATGWNNFINQKREEGRIESRYNNVLEGERLITKITDIRRSLTNYKQLIINGTAIRRFSVGGSKFGDVQNLEMIAHAFPNLGANIFITKPYLFPTEIPSCLEDKKDVCLLRGSSVRLADELVVNPDTFFLSQLQDAFSKEYTDIVLENVHFYPLPQIDRSKFNLELPSRNEELLTMCYTTICGTIDGLGADLRGALLKSAAEMTAVGETALVNDTIKLKELLHYYAKRLDEYAKRVDELEKKRKLENIRSEDEDALD